MDEKSMLVALGECQNLLTEAKLGSTDSELFIKALYQLDGLSQSIVNQNSYDVLLTESWRLQSLQSISCEIDGCLQLVKENGVFQHSMCYSFVHMANILWSAFTFCKETGGKCCVETEEVKEKLTTLFKQCYQNLKVMTDIVEKFPCNRLAEDINFLHNVFINLIKCSQVLCDIDIMASVTVWKSMKRLIVQHKEVVLNNVEMFYCLFDVCHLTVTTLTQCFQTLEKKDSIASNKLQKVVRFFLGIVLLLTKDFKDMMSKEACIQVYHLILLIQRLSLIETRKDYEAKDCSAEYEYLSNSLLCVSDPLLKDFVETSGSAQCILENLSIHNEGDRYEGIINLMNILSVVEYLTDRTELIDHWLQQGPQRVHIEEKLDCLQTRRSQSHHTILDALFTCLQGCSSQLFKERKDYVLVDQAQEVSLYEFVLGRLGTFALTLPQKYFAHLELVMLTNILSSFRYCVLLATDLWCFISRWVKPELCLHHFTFLGKMLVHLHDVGSDDVVISNLSCLLKRLYWFLEDNQHKQIVERFPIIPHNVVVWKLLPWPHLNIANKLDLCSQMFSMVTSLMELKEEKESSSAQVVCGVECLSQLLLNDGDLYNGIPGGLKQRLNEQVCEFWTCFANVKEDVEISELLVVAMLNLTSQLMALSFEGRMVHHVLCTIRDILQSTESIAFQVGCANFITRLRSVTFPCENESECLLTISQIFRSLLTQQDWLVEECSMRTLQQFAEKTVYSRALLTFLPPSKKKEFANYLKKELPAISVAGEGSLSDLVVEYISCEKNTANGESTVRVESETPFRDVIDSLEKNIKTLNELTKKHGLPPESVTRIKNLISIVEDLCS